MMVAPAHHLGIGPLLRQGTVNGSITPRTEVLSMA